jgi:hypothetical protein
MQTEMIVLFRTAEVFEATKSADPAYISIRIPAEVEKFLRES